jgi:hypothetical protein
MHVAAALLAALLAFAGADAAAAGDWNSSPNRWENSADNWLNSPSRWENSPHHWLNSPHRFGNERILRDSGGAPWGYVVPKPDGGANLFDFQGNRRGYIPAR